MTTLKQYTFLRNSFRFCVSDLRFCCCDRIIRDGTQAPGNRPVFPTDSDRSGIVGLIVPRSVVVVILAVLLIVLRSVIVILTVLLIVPRLV